MTNWKRKYSALVLGAFTLVATGLTGCGGSAKSEDVSKSEPTLHQEVFQYSGGKLIYAGASNIAYKPTILSGPITTHDGHYVAFKDACAGGNPVQLGSDFQILTKNGPVRCDLLPKVETLTPKAE